MSFNFDCLKEPKKTIDPSEIPAPRPFRPSDPTSPGASSSSYLNPPEPAFQLLPPDQCAMDPKVIDLVRLHSYELNLQESRSAFTSEEEFHVPAPPPLATLSWSATESGSYVPVPLTVPPLALPSLPDLAELNENVARQILKKSVCTLIASVGFSQCLESTLDTLTDVAHEYLLNLSLLIQRHKDRQMANSSRPSASKNLPPKSTLHEPIARSLSDLKTGNPRQLMRWYQDSVVKAVKVAAEKCERLRIECQAEWAGMAAAALEKTLEGGSSSERELLPVTVKVEEEVEEVHGGEPALFSPVNTDPSVAGSSGSMTPGIVSTFPQSTEDVLPTYPSAPQS